MKLYYSKGACSLAVRLVVHEIGVPCEFESVDLKTKKTETDASFLKINPKGAVPTLVLDSGEVLTENAIIQQYLADTYKATSLLPPVGNLERYHVLEWLNFVSTEIHKGFSPLFNFAVPDDVKKTIFIPLLKNKLSFIENHLQNSLYLAGDHFTLPDAYLFTTLRWLHHFKINISEWPHLNRYYTELENRPAIQQSLREEQLSR